MSKWDVPFDRDRFIKHCCNPCNKGREVLLEKIEQYKTSDPEVSQWLQWHVDHLWREQVAKDEYHQMSIDRGNEQFEKDAAAALRAVADKLDEKGMHFMIHCELPPLPVFSGKDRVEQYSCDITVSLVAGPLGG